MGAINNYREMPTLFYWSTGGLVEAKEITDDYVAVIIGTYYGNTNVTKCKRRFDQRGREFIQPYGVGVGRLYIDEAIAN